MKRLRILSERINTHDDIDISPLTDDVDSMSGLKKLDQLSEADMRHNRCPNCGYSKLKRDNGIKACPKCNNRYKMINGIGYLLL